MFDILFGTKDAFTPLKFEVNHRTFFLCIEGSVTIKLFLPKASNVLSGGEDYLNFEFFAKKKFQNPWKKNINKKNSKKSDAFLLSSSIDIVLTKGDILFIPPYWWFSILFTEDISFLLQFNYRTYMNTLAILPKLGKHMLQRQQYQLFLSPFCF